MHSLFLFAALAVPAAALNIEREEYKIIGWNDACSVALEHYAFPKLGEAIQDDPVMTRVGTLSITAQKPAAETRWALEADGANTYDEPAIRRIRRELREAGYNRTGFDEIIPASATAGPPGSVEIILSTAVLGARSGSWPDAQQWRWGRAHYNPLGTCALLVYEKIGERDRFQFLLTRIDNARARSDRGRAHATNGRRLFHNGDLDGALAETEIGAKLAPELADTHYHHAAMLALTGRIDDAMRELLISAKIDRRFVEKAAKDEDFDSLRGRQDFQELLPRH